jgi:hypothetical protein
MEFYVRLNPKHPLLSFHVFQYIYFFALAALFGMQKIMTSIGEPIKGYLRYLSLCVSQNRRQQIGLFLILSRNVARHGATRKTLFV